MKTNESTNIDLFGPIDEVIDRLIQFKFEHASADAIVIEQQWSSYEDCDEVVTVTRDATQEEEKEEREKEKREEQRQKDIAKEKEKKQKKRARINDLRSEYESLTGRSI